MQDNLCHPYIILSTTVLSDRGAVDEKNESKFVCFSVSSMLSWVSSRSLSPTLYACAHETRDHVTFLIRKNGRTTFARLSLCCANSPPDKRVKADDMKSAVCLLTLFVAGELLGDTPGTLSRAFDCVVYTGATCVYTHVAAYVCSWWCVCLCAKSVFV